MAHERVPDQDRHFGRLQAFRDENNIVYWVPVEGYKGPVDIQEEDKNNIPKEKSQ